MISIKETVGSYLRNRRALEELRRLDDRALSDIGLTRFDLKDAVKFGQRGAASSSRGRNPGVSYLG